MCYSWKLKRREMLARTQALNIIVRIWQLGNNLIVPRLQPDGFVDNILGNARCELRLSSHYPVEESVTFKNDMQPRLTRVIRDVHYGLWSHPVNIYICVCACVEAGGQSSVESYLALWHEPTFPFTVPYSCPSLPPHFK